MKTHPRPEGARGGATSNARTRRWPNARTATDKADPAPTGSSQTEASLSNKSTEHLGEVFRDRGLPWSSPAVRSPAVASPPPSTCSVSQRTILVSSQVSPRNSQPINRPIRSSRRWSSTSTNVTTASASATPWPAVGCWLLEAGDSGEPCANVLSRRLTDRDSDTRRASGNLSNRGGHREPRCGPRSACWVTVAQRGGCHVPH